MRKKIIEVKHLIEKNNHEISYQKNNKLTYVNDKLYKIETDYWNSMYSSRDTASARGFYKKQLLKIINTIRSGKFILIENKTISSVNELQQEMREWDGFQNIENELGKD